MEAVCSCEMLLPCMYQITEHYNQHKAIFIVTIVRTSNLTELQYVCARIKVGTIN